nr:enterochelin esterase domain-containing protein [Streptomyces sp. SID8379]
MFSNRLVDRARLADALLHHIPGTGIWHLGFRLRADHRGAYRIAADVSVGRPPTPTGSSGSCARSSGTPGPTRSTPAPFPRVGAAPTAPSSHCRTLRRGAGRAARARSRAAASNGTAWTAPRWAPNATCGCTCRPGPATATCPSSSLVTAACGSAATARASPTPWTG